MSTIELNQLSNKVLFLNADINNLHITVCLENELVMVSYENNMKDKTNRASVSIVHRNMNKVMELSSIIS